MKIERKQEVRSFGILSLVCMAGALLAMTWPVFNEHVGKAQEGTLRRAESLAYQVLESRRVSSRGPASASEATLNQLALDQGEIGSDSWGQPYQFKLLKPSHSKQTRVLVWSLGPNGKSDTSVSEFESSQEPGNPVFQGDDLGVVVSAK